MRADWFHQQFSYAFHIDACSTVTTFKCMCLTQLLTPFRAWCTTHFQNAQHHALYIGQMSRKNKLWRNVQKIEPEKRPGGQIIDKRILIVRGKGADFSGFNKGPVSLGFKSLFLLLTSRIPLRFFLSVETEDNHHELYTTVAKKKKKKDEMCHRGTVPACRKRQRSFPSRKGTRKLSNSEKATRVLSAPSWPGWLRHSNPSLPQGGSGCQRTGPVT